MEFDVLFGFFINSSVFSFTITLIAFVLGWLLYNNVILRKICLRDSLFEKDNVAAWVEFIGAFIFPTLYLAAKAIEGPAHEDLLMDLLICAGYTVAYTVLFTALRMLSGLIINFIGAGDSEGRISLNNEVYNQKNVAASLFSVALSVVFVSTVRFLDILPGYFMASVLKLLMVLVFSLAAFITYFVFLRRKTTLFKEIFIDNNIAAGAAFLGFIYAVETIVSNIIVINNQGEFDFISTAVTIAIALIVFGLMSFIFKAGTCRFIRVNMWKEIYEEDNLGASIGQAALYIGIATIIVHFMK